MSQTTAWKVKHKLKQVMIERDATKKLTGRIEIDDAYLGGEHSGGKRGRGAAGKQTTADGKRSPSPRRHVLNSRIMAAWGASFASGP